MKDSEIIVGIDLGTTNSLVGVVDSGFPIILADDESRRILPSVVFYSEQGEVSVGYEAQRGQILHPEKTVSSVKRFIGRSLSDLSPEEVESLPYKISSDGKAGLLIDGRSPLELSAEILRKLKTIAGNALETEVTRAVITVPAYFNNDQRELTKRAGEMAGFTVERIINEPTAAALAYGLDQLDDAQTVAVYDLGGGTFDLSILEMRDGLFEVISTAGDTRLGGDDIDSAVVCFLLKKLSISADELRPEQRVHLSRVARELKEFLSEEDRFMVRLPFFHNDLSYEFEVTRSDFDKIAAPVIDRTQPICRRAFVEAANKGTTRIDHLILVGGSTRIPQVREKLRQWFDLEPDLSQHPDEAIGLGAAIQAGILCGRIQNIVLVDVTPLSLGIETFGGLMNVIIQRNATIPVKAGELFTNAVANQKSMAIRVLQGEREMARDNWLLGEVEVPFNPGPKGSARVGVQFEIDQNGILKVLSRDTETGNDTILEIRNAAVDTDDAAVEQMISESIDFAFEDMNERVWTEAAAKSNELLPAVELALEKVGGQLDSEETAQIENAVRKVSQILALEDKDAQALKQANTILDEATQTLAALLVEQAFSDL